MNTKSVHKQAKTDAAEYAGAYMAYGEGAGTRRKLIEGTVDYKMAHVPGYREAFIAEHDRQDMAKHADKARKANRRAAVTKSIERNGKAIATGKTHNADLSILGLIAVGTIAHQTGADKKALEFGKRKLDQIKRKYQAKRKKPAQPDSDGVYNITDAR